VSLIGQQGILEFRVGFYEQEHQNNITLQYGSCSSPGNNCNMNVILQKLVMTRGTIRTGIRMKDEVVTSSGPE
jgi:hypothetical protein